MRFLEFFAQAKKKSFWQENRVICFQAESYPLLFCRMLFKFLKEQDVACISPLQAEDRLTLWKTLQQSFLGETSFYWLGSITEKIKSKKRKNEPDIVEILSLYRGPHSVAFFLPTDYKLSVSAKKRMVVVDVSEKLSIVDARELFLFFNHTLSSTKSMRIADLMKRAGRVPLDICCMLTNYFVVTNLRHVDELERNLISMIDPELSLYDLSQAFFSKNSKKLFSLWASCHNDYTMPFWVAYWSEQIWRAYNVTNFLKQKNFPAAKRFSFRLPSSFIKTDWRKTSLSGLKHAYNMLYDIDFAFKKGSTFCSLDLFYSNYFLG
jgi:hypothetical protein